MDKWQEVKEAVVKLGVERGLGIIRACPVGVAGVGRDGRFWNLGEYQGTGGAELWMQAYEALTYGCYNEANDAFVRAIIEHQTECLRRCAIFMTIIHFIENGMGITRRGDLLITFKVGGEEDVLAGPTDAEASVLWDWAFRQIVRGGHLGPTNFFRRYREG